MFFRPQGGKDCEGPSTKYTACNAEQCLNVPKMTIKEFADQICNRAREVEKEFTGTGMQKISSDRKYTIGRNALNYRIRLKKF